MGCRTALAQNRRNWGTRPSPSTRIVASNPRRLLPLGYLTGSMRVSGLRTSAESEPTSTRQPRFPPKRTAGSTACRPVAQACSM